MKTLKDRWSEITTNKSAIIILEKLHEKRYFSSSNRLADTTGLHPQTVKRILKGDKTHYSKMPLLVYFLPKKSKQGSKQAVRLSPLGCIIYHLFKRYKYDAKNNELEELLLVLHDHLAYKPKDAKVTNVIRWLYENNEKLHNLIKKEVFRCPHCRTIIFNYEKTFTNDAAENGEKAGEKSFASENNIPSAKSTCSSKKDTKYGSVRILEEKSKKEEEKKEHIIFSAEKRATADAEVFCENSPPNSEKTSQNENAPRENENTNSNTIQNEKICCSEKLADENCEKPCQHEKSLSKTIRNEKNCSSKKLAEENPKISRGKDESLSKTIQNEESCSSEKLAEKKLQRHRKKTKTSSEKLANGNDKIATSSENESRRKKDKKTKPAANIRTNNSYELKSEEDRRIAEAFTEIKRLAWGLEGLAMRCQFDEESGLPKGFYTYKAQAILCKLLYASYKMVVASRRPPKFVLVPHHPTRNDMLEFYPLAVLILTERDEQLRRKYIVGVLETMNRYFETIFSFRRESLPIKLEKDYFLSAKSYLKCCPKLVDLYKLKVSRA